MHCHATRERAVDAWCPACHNPTLARVSHARARARHHVEITDVAPEARELLAIDAPLARALGGSVPAEGALVLVAGPPSAGKSTEAARLLSWARALDIEAAWLDAEQAPGELAAILERVGAPNVARIVGEDLSDAMRAAIRRRAQLIIIDSLSEWCEGSRAVHEAIKELLELAAGRWIIAIMHENQRGKVAGRTLSSYRAHAVVRVTPTLITPLKCRWAIGQKVTRKQPDKPRSPKPRLRSA